MVFRWFEQFNGIDTNDCTTGQTLGETKWKRGLESFERVIFVPTAHAGPYLGKFHGGDTLWVLFGARLPQGVRFHAPDLSRAEIIMRLSALTDDNRLRILKLVSEEGEQSSQDIMSHLTPSQTAQRHRLSHRAPLQRRQMLRAGPGAHHKHA